MKYHDMKFRKDLLYRGEFYVSATIPRTEDLLVVPCAAKRCASGLDWQYDIAVLYAAGDLCFAVDRAKGIMADHPGWAFDVRRVNTGASVLKVAAA